MLDDYKELCRCSASVVSGWEQLSKNDLCRACALNKENPQLHNAYLSAILYKYWNLIGKYYYMSANCATPEDCYEWLLDSVLCCVNLAAWEDPKSSIYRDPNGPDKVINRCMKCARLTYYQFINRKKRRDNFGLLSIDELKEMFGNGVTEPVDHEQEFDVSSIMIREHIVKAFLHKDYFVAFLLDAILTSDIFDITTDSKLGLCYQFNLRKLIRVLNKIDDDYLFVFSSNYELDLEIVTKGFQYIKSIPNHTLRKKILQTFENLKHTDLIKSLLTTGDNNAD